MQFGDILRQLLENSNTTQKQLGLQLNIAPTTIGNYVRNLREPDYNTLKMFAAYFNVTTDFLLDYHSEQSKVHDEDVLLHTYRSLNEKNREILVEQAHVLCKFQPKK